MCSPPHCPGSRPSPPTSSSPRSPTNTQQFQPALDRDRGLALRMPRASPGSRSSPPPSSSPRLPARTHNSFSQPWIVTPDWLCACPQPVRGHDPHPRHPLRLAHLPATKHREFVLASLGSRCFERGEGCHQSDLLRWLTVI
jgi:hypothetical protein